MIGTGWTGSEQTFQMAAVQLIRMKYHQVRVLHIPNGAHISARIGAIRKRMGATAGAPDLLVQFPGGKTIELELKTDRGRLSMEQLAWSRESQDLGIAYYVCRTLDEVDEIVGREAAQ